MTTTKKGTDRLSCAVLFTRGLSRHVHVHAAAWYMHAWIAVICRQKSKCSNYVLIVRHSHTHIESEKQQVAD